MGSHNNDRKKHVTIKPTEAKEKNGDYYLNAEGIAKIIYLTALHEVSPQMRTRIERAQERVNAALAAEHCKAFPRSVDAVIVDVLNVKGMEARLRAGDIDGAIALALDGPPTS